MKKVIFLFSLILTSCINKPPSPDNIKIEIINSMFIYEEASFPQCHASTILETDGGLIAAWFGGTHERHPDVCIYVSLMKNNKWSDPVMAADGVINDTLRYPCWNPVLFKRNNNDIILFYKVGPNPREWWGAYKISKDSGKTWSSAIQIPDKLLGPIKNKPVVLKNGNILHPSSIETPQDWKVHMEISDQELKSWQKINIDNGSFNAIQPTILIYRDRSIQILCRSREQRVVESWSKDQGKTWTPLKATSIVNNNSGLDAVSLSNGLQILVCNPIEKGRNKLSVLASNNGLDWKEMKILEDQAEGEYSYPAIIAGSDGTLHVTYTYKRERVKYVHLKVNKK